MASCARNGKRAASWVLLLLLITPATARGQRKVENVLFEGNENFPRKTLLGLTRVEEVGRWRLVFTFRHATYNVLVLARDKAVLRAFYRNRGFLQCSIDERVEPVGENGLIVHFLIDEGARTRLEQIEFEGNAVFSDEVLLQRVRRVRSARMAAGDPVSEAAIQAATTEIARQYRELGYYFARVTFRLQERDPVTGTAALTFRIEEGRPVYVRDVEVHGNRLAKGFIVTREVTLDPGDLLKESQRRESQRRLYLTGVFRTANVTVGGVSPDSTAATVLVTVAEQQPRYLELGGGISKDIQESIDMSLRLSGEWGHRNLYGTGRSLSLSASADFQVVTAWKVPQLIRRELSLRYTEPWFMGTRTPITAQFSLRPQVYDQYRVSEFAIEAGYSREFTPQERFWGGGTVRFIRTDIPAEVLVRQDALRGGSLNWERDTRDNFFSPTTGSVTRFGLRAYNPLGLLGGPEYGIMNAFWSRYTLLTPSTVAALRLRAATASPMGETGEVPIFDRFFGGGTSSVRGYAERSLGPVSSVFDSSSGVTAYRPRGGQARMMMGAELRWPRLMPTPIGPMGAVLFVDAGNVWAHWKEARRGLVAALGFGVFLDSPLGPLRIDLGWRLNRSLAERDIPGYRLPVRKIHFAIGHAF